MSANTKNSTNLLKKERKPFNTKGLFLWLLIFFVTFLIVYAGIALYQANKLYKESFAGKDAIESAMLYAKEKDFINAQKHFIQAASHFENANSAYKYIKVAEVLPSFRHELRFASALLVMGEKGSAFASESLQLLADEDELSFSAISDEKKQELLQYIVDSNEDFQTLNVAITDTLDEAHILQQKGMSSQIKPIYDRVIPQLEEAKPILDFAIPVMQILPELAGYPEEKTYLILLQNNHELRATGGFIGTYGILKVKNAEIQTLFTDNIYNLDNPARNAGFHIDPPWQITKYMDVKHWLLRDANWDPHVPNSAQKAIWFYNQEGGTEKIDGVIALTPVVIERLLNIIGPVEVHGQAYTSENLVEILQFKVEKEYYIQGISEEDRKEIINVLAQTLKERLFELDLAGMTQLFAILQTSLDEKHLWSYSEHDDVQRLMSQYGWTGEIQEAFGDYFYFVDSNLAALKTDAVLDRRIEYRIEKNEEGKYIATASMTYDNQGTFTWKTTRYRTYTRLYVPKGSKLIAHSGVMDMDRSQKPGEVEVIEDEHGKTRFGAFIAIEPGKTGTLSFTYELPESIQKQIEKNTYSLFVQKQLGTKAHALHLNLAFDKAIQSATVSEESQNFGDTSYTIETDLRTDKDFLIHF